MKKTLLAATLAAAVSGAFAADVTLYGVADVGLRYTNTKTDGVSTDKLEMMSGHNAGSRFGLKGSEDLGNGWKAGFQLEGQYLVDTGALKNAKFFHRLATVSISGPLGTVYAGRMGTFSSAAGPADLIFAAGDAFDGGDNLIYALSVESRRDNTLLYVTPAAGGLQGYLQYSFQGSGQENVQSSLNERYMGAGLRWKAGAFESALAVEHVRYAAAADDVKGALDDKLAVSLAANYDFGVTKLFGTAQWVQGGDNFGAVSDYTARGLDGWAVEAGSVTPAFGGLVYATVGYARGDHSDYVTDARDFDFSHWCVGGRYWHPLSKRTAVYTGAGWYQWDKDTVAGGTDHKEKFCQIYAGITHKF